MNDNDTMADLFSGYDIDDIVDHEENWSNGIHRDQNNKEWKLEEMTTSHIQNTIRYFDYLNTSALKKELKRRTA